MKLPAETVTITTGRRCPLHGDTLRYAGKHQLVCTKRVQLNTGGTAVCPHTEYRAAVNPAMRAAAKPETIVKRLKSQMREKSP